MFISDTEYLKNQFGKHLKISIAVLAFGVIYELFSHGVLSMYMLLAFLIPLLLGAMPYLFLMRQTGKTTARYSIPKISAGFLNAAVYTFTLGSLMKGALDIYGTTNSLVRFYFPAGILLAAFAAGTALFNRYRRVKIRNT